MGDGFSTPSRDINYSYIHVYGSYAKFGYLYASYNEDLILRDNRFSGTNYSLFVQRWWNLDVSYNIVYASDSWNRLVDFIYPSISTSYSWDNNTNYSSGSHLFEVDDQGETFPMWKTLTGFDAASTLSTSAPIGTEVFFYANEYEDKRGNVVIYNWDGISTVSVDISSLGFELGDRYVFHQVLNY